MSDHTAQCGCKIRELEPGWEIYDLCEEHMPMVDDAIKYLSLAFGVEVDAGSNVVEHLDRLDAEREQG